MIDVMVRCNKCQRVFQVETELRSAVNPICGHGTITAPDDRPNLLQCTCGNYLDRGHVMRPKNQVIQERG
jgi:hypothetical protein